MFPAWQATLQVTWLDHHPQTVVEQLKPLPGFTVGSVRVTRTGEGSEIRVTYWAPEGILSNPAPRLVVLCGQETESGEGAVKS